MARCEGCGGVVGVDCFNPAECQWIAEDMAQRQPEPEYSEEEYCAGYGHPFYGTLPDGSGRCLCGHRVYPAQMDSALRAHFVRCIHYDIETVPYTGHITPWETVVSNWREHDDRRLPKRLRVIPDRKYG